MGGRPPLAGGLRGLGSIDDGSARGHSGGAGVSEPLRTCVGCRRAKPAPALVRLARLPSGEVVVDSTRRLPGRGAYLCPESACLTRGLERGRLAHAFRKPCEVRANLAKEVSERWPQPR
ncbi:MAG: YlxR family protein [Candidatus Rokuibacteriota bacterium]